MQINIKDDLYNCLQLNAEANFRTPELQLAYILSNIYEGNVSGGITQSLKDIVNKLQPSTLTQQESTTAPSSSVHAELWNQAPELELGIVDVSASREAFERGLID